MPEQKVENKGTRLARISHRIPAASADSTAIAARIDQAADCSMSIQLHRHLADSRHTASTLHALATKSGEKSGLNIVLFCEFRKRADRSNPIFEKEQLSADEACIYFAVGALRKSLDAPLGALATLRKALAVNDM